MTEANDVVAEAELDQAEAREHLERAMANFEAKKAEVAAAKKSQEPVPDPAKHVFIESGDGLELIALPEAPEKSRRLTIDGANHEVVSVGENGVWVYRRM